MDATGWTEVGVLLTVGVQSMVFFRWIARRMRDDDINRAFVQDIALIHLPHVYQALRDLADAQGIDLREPPLVQFVDFNNRRKRRVG